MIFKIIYQVLLVILGVSWVYSVRFNYINGLPVSIIFKNVVVSLLELILVRLVLMKYVN